MTGDDVVVNCFPFVGLNVSGIGTEGGLAALGVETVPIGNTPYPPEHEFDLIRRHQPTDSGNYVITGLASHLDAKAMQFVDTGRDPATLGFDLVVIAGEPVSETRKSHLAEVYDADVYEYLGSTEGGAFAFECLEKRGLHVLGEFVHAEVVDPETGNRLDSGKNGSLAITPLIAPGDESAMPLLRYRLGDLVTKLDDSTTCSCPLSTYPRITPPQREGSKSVVGAVNLHPLFIEQHIYDHPKLRKHVREYQIELDYEESTGRDVLRILLECDAEGPDEDLSDITGETSADSAGAELGTAYYGTTVTYGIRSPRPVRSGSTFASLTNSTSVRANRSE